MAEDLNPTEVAKAISRMVNVGSKDNLALLAELLVNDHRTLQQGIMRDLIVPLLKLWSEDFEAGRFDARNEATVKFAHQVISLPEMAFPFI